MDFFKAQDDARRRTWQLGLLFAGAVVTLIILTNLFVGIVLVTFGGVNNTVYISDSPTFLLSLVPLDYWLMITAGVIAIVGMAMLYKYLRLRGGGRVLAESFGGRLLTRDQADFKEKRLLNVVEEMAIASGMPVPPVYILDEPGINAFAAGHSVEDAVIGINRGALDTLNREELQGVIAHEFSHVLNGDMRLNLKLIAVLHGILFIGLVGRVIARQSAGSRKSAVPAMLFGAGLVLIGYGGTFFGNIIKAAVSRQREFLADAAAVQFTRNPGGISGALKKIGGFTAGSSVNNTNANEASHLFFGQVTTRQFLAGLFATHPPLDIRIRAIEPRWNGEFPAQVPQLPDADDADAAGISRFASTHAPAGEPSAALISTVGNPDAAALERAQSMIRLADKALTLAAHESFSAVALMYAMLLGRDDAVRTAQLSSLEVACSPEVTAEVARLDDLLDTVDQNQKSLLLSMSIPALKTLSTAQYRAFQQRIVELANQDDHIDLFEWMVCVTLLKDLTPHYVGAIPARVRFNSPKQVEDELLILLSSLSSTATRSVGERRDLVEAGFRTAGLKIPAQPLPAADFTAVNSALGKLRLLAPLQKPKVLKAMVATLQARDGIDQHEHALVQLIAGALDCPVPPMASLHQ